MLHATGGLAASWGQAPWNAVLVQPQEFLVCIGRGGMESPVVLLRDKHDSDGNF